MHRSTLTKDKSAFETMFQLSSETDSSRSDSSMTVTTEGEGDENPIRLQGDTADEFRALLWSLYALYVPLLPSDHKRLKAHDRPHELVVALTPEADCNQLVNLARITSKYQFRSLEAWALGALHTYFSRNGAFDDIPTSHEPNPPILPPGFIPSPQLPSLVQITELATLCERFDLLEVALVRWRHLVGEGRDLALAIDVGERFNLRPILGIAYHAMMLKGKAHWDTEAALTRDRRVRLLYGYYSLCKLWENLAGSPPVLTHSTRCTSQARCNKSFTMLWKLALENWTSQPMPVFQREDVLGRLMWTESMMKAFVKDDIRPEGLLDGVVYCKENVLSVMAFRFKEIKDNLADHFADDF